MSGWSDIRPCVAGQREALIDSLGQPREQQLRLLRHILKSNQDTEFGQRFDFRTVGSMAEYQQRIALHDYDDFRAAIDRMMAGAENVLCAEKVLLFERTSGSTGGDKFLPFVESGLHAMRNALLPWLDDLLTARPGILRGKAYWSISPANRQKSHTPGGIPLGMDNDALYFGEHLALAITTTLAVPASVAAIASFDDWQLATLCHLLACEDLSFVSVWSPTYFLQLLDSVPSDIDRIAAAIESGRMEIGFAEQLLQPNATRAKQLRRLFATDPPQWDKIWPALDTISCWDSASSRKYADELRKRFPTTHVQGKGLLATEGVVTVPLSGASSPVLAVDSGVYEFVAGTGEVLLPWELETGQTYAVIITTAAGLYRYQLGDRVTVTGWHEATPCLKYVGRECGGSDLCGEKLTVDFVEMALDDIPGFSLLVPVTDPRPAYLLLLDAALITEAQEQAVATQVDHNLMRNSQYRYARDLGQLPAPMPRRIKNPLGVYKDICMSSGQQLGNIKVSALASDLWAIQFHSRISG